MSGAICAGFVPHGVRATRCKRCFREVGDHNEPEQKLRTKAEGKGAKLRPKSAEIPSSSTVAHKRRREAVAGAGKSNAAAAPSDDVKRANRRSREVKVADDGEVDGGGTRRSRKSDDADGHLGTRRVQIVAAEEVEKTPRLSTANFPPEDSNEITSPDVEFILKVIICSVRFVMPCTTHTI